jgi:prophage regulatory protein
MSRLLRLAAVKERTGLSRSSIYAHPDFPRPVKIGAGGRAVAWVESEILEWVNDRIKAREVA